MYYSWCFLSSFMSSSSFMAVLMSPWTLSLPLVKAAIGRSSPWNMSRRSRSLIFRVTSGSRHKDPSPAAPLPKVQREIDRFHFFMFSYTHLAPSKNSIIMTFITLAQIHIVTALLSISWADVKLITGPNLADQRLREEQLDFAEQLFNTTWCGSDRLGSTAELIRKCYAVLWRKRWRLQH